MKGYSWLNKSLTISFFFYVLLVNGEAIGGSYDEEAGKAYLKKINAEIQVKTTENVLASWAYESNITDKNLRNQLDVSAKLANFTKEIWKETIKYPWKTYKDPDVRRQFQKFSVLGTAILSSQKYERFNKIISDMQSTYGKAKICNYNNRTDCNMQLEPELTEIFAKSRDPDELRYYWEQWRNAAGKPVRKMFKEYVDLSNEAAVLNNFTDNAEFWLKDYEAKDFKDQVEVLWQQLRPLYLQLHAYVRRRLREQYGEEHVTKRGPIPAHLLGNMWAQSWGNIFDFTVPYPGKPSMDVTPNMVNQGYTPIRMFKLAEEFFTSLNLSPMPDTFWKNSILEKPKDGRDLICHASAWDFFDGKDFRIKQCTRITMEDLNTVHHEMGHIQYFLQYKNQPLVYKEGTNPGFHEAVGDVMALSVSTPKHLRKIGLLNDTQDDDESEINQLFNMALDKIAFLPFGFLMDQWRWSVFEKEITEKDYNCKWWQLREKYQGLSPSVIRTETDFDPGAKYHTVGNVPYIRYFVSFVIQFQFHRSLCIAANEFDPNDPASKPLHKCDIYQSKEAGALLKKMLQMGSSKPWPDAMEVITGQRQMDARALLDYFATLKTWLEAENKRTGEFIGWESSQKVCGWDEEANGAAPSSDTEGNFEDNNIAYSYAEFVPPNDNNFGVPDYLEEAKPSYHSLIHRSKESNLQENYFTPANSDNSFSKNDEIDDIFIPKPYLEDQHGIVDISKLERLKSRLDKGSNKKYTNQKIKDDSSYKMCKIPIKDHEFKEAFEVRSRNQEVEKTKILNAILKDLHHLKINKGTGNSVTPYKKTSNRETGSEDKVTEDKSESKKEKLEGGLKEDKKKDPNLELKENLKEENLPSKNFPKEREEELKPSNKAETSSNNECKAHEGKAECVLEKLKNFRQSVLDSQIPNIELMWEAELVKNEAQKMLKNFNFSAYNPNVSNLSESTFASGPESENSPDLSKKVLSTEKSNKKTRQILLLNPREKYNRPKKAVNSNSLENLFKNAGLGSLKTNLDGRKYADLVHFKEYDLMDIIPIELSKEKRETLKETYKRTNEANEYLMLVGKQANQQDAVHKKKYKKKSYKEYHYNVRTPVLYNAIVITAGGNKGDKTDEPSNRWSRISDRMTNSLNYKKSLGAGQIRKRRIVQNFQKSHPNQKNFNRFSRTVKRQKLNIKNILQYFGLIVYFV